MEPSFRRGNGTLPLLASVPFRPGPAPRASGFGEAPDGPERGGGGAMAAGSAEARGRAVTLPRLDVRLLAGLALVAVSVAGGLSLWSAARTTTQVVVAARDIGPGAVISEDDVTLAEARLQGRLAGLALPGAELGSAVGRTATGAIWAGELVVRPDLGSGPVVGPGELAVTIPVGDDSVFSRLRRGALVAVMATSEPGRPGSRTVALLERAVVYAVALESTRVSLGGSGDASQDGRPANVTLVIPRERAEAVAHALVNGELTLLLLAEEAEPGPASDGEGGRP